MNFKRLLAAAAAVSTLVAAAQALAANPSASHQVLPGLSAPGEILVDHWGIPHIYAASEHDAYFLQGWNVARDRLWEIDLWRKRGLGRLSASFGPAYAAQDQAARLLLYRGSMEAEWAAYAPGARAAAEAFAAGVNAYVDQTLAGAGKLPVEFALTGSKPEHWTADDIVRIRSHALVANLTSEVARARTACAAGLEADAVRRRLEPAHAASLPAGLDPCVVDPHVLDAYVLGTQAVKFEKGAVRMAAIDPTQFAHDAAQEGSNNWVVAPWRTDTGRPILANDPHRQLGAPSLRYVAHLDAPGLHLIGAGEPALPGVSFGHNDKAAFGLTIFGIDQEDLYVYDLDPKHPDRYRYGKGWERMTRVVEALEVKGEAPRDISLNYTRHGPVLYITPDHRHAFALRSVWAQPGASGYYQASWLAHASSWPDFKAAHDHWGAPPLNLVFADVAGETGWAGSGLTPKRPNWDGLAPVPGDGRYEWAGFLSGDELPVIRDPKRGFIATANEMNLPSDYPAESRKVSFEWGDRSRIDRINEILDAAPKISIATSMAAQTDSHVAMASRLQSLIADLKPAEPHAAAAVERLKAWNRDEGIGSVEATIYELWAVKHLGRTMIAHVAPKAAGSLGAPEPDALFWLLEHPDARLGADPSAAREAILLESLQATLADLTDRLGPDMNSWTWGRLHHATWAPAAAALADPALRAKMTVGPLPIPGGGKSPKASTYSANDFNVISGASVRMVMDVGAWDNSVIINTPGQSGDPDSPHYRDLFPLWASGAYVPMLFSRTAVEAATEMRMTFAPAAP